MSEHNKSANAHETAARAAGWHPARHEPRGVVRRAATEEERRANFNQPWIAAHSWRDACEEDGLTVDVASPVGAPPVAATFEKRDLVTFVSHDGHAYDARVETAHRDGTYTIVVLFPQRADRQPGGWAGGYLGHAHRVGPESLTRRMRYAAPAPVVSAPVAASPAAESDAMGVLRALVAAWDDAAPAGEEEGIDEQRLVESLTDIIPDARALLAGRTLWRRHVASGAMAFEPVPHETRPGAWAIRAIGERPSWAPGGVFGFYLSRGEAEAGIAALLEAPRHGGRPVAASPAPVAVASPALAALRLVIGNPHAALAMQQAGQLDAVKAAIAQAEGRPVAVAPAPVAAWSDRISDSDLVAVTVARVMGDDDSQA
jgi:hypothetical protein